MIIKNGELFDSDSKTFKKKDILIENQFIKLIAEQISPLENQKIIYADRLQVIPGFIDIHTHADWSILDKNYTDIKLAQGVTTEVVGNCGFSLFPFDKNFENLRPLIQLMGENRSGVFTSFKEYQNYLKSREISLNLGSLVGHSSLLLSKKLSLEQYSSLLEELLDQGARGISTGLDYAPGCFSSTNEIIKVARALRGKPYVTHMRGGPDWIESTKEVLKILEVVGKVHVSHLKPAKENLQEILSLLDKPGVSYDIYPFTSSQTFITSLIPKEYLQDGLESFLTKLEYTDLSRSLENSLIIKNFEGISVSSHPNEKYLSRELKEIAHDKGISVGETIIKLIRESNGTCSIIKQRRNYSETEMLEVLKNQKCILASDSVPIKSKGTYQFCHPRLYNTYPSVFGNLVRREKLNIADAILKTTSNPAKILDIPLRGELREGYFADILVGDLFNLLIPNPEQNPQKLTPFFKEVFINGVQAVENYTFKSASSGMII